MDPVVPTGLRKCFSAVVQSHHRSSLSASQASPPVSGGPPSVCSGVTPPAPASSWFQVMEQTHHQAPHHQSPSRTLPIVPEPLYIAVPVACRDL